MLNCKLSESNRTCNTISSAILKYTNKHILTQQQTRGEWLLIYMKYEDWRCDCWIQCHLSSTKQPVPTKKKGEHPVIFKQFFLVHSEGHSGKRRTFVSVLENWTISILQGGCGCVWESIYKRCAATVLVLFQKCIKMDVWDIMLTVHKYRAGTVDMHLSGFHYSLRPPSDNMQM